MLLSSISGALCLGEVAHDEFRMPPSSDGGLHVKFSSRAVQQVRGQYRLPTRVKRKRVWGQDYDPLLPPLIYSSAYTRKPAFTRTDKTPRSGPRECSLCEGFTPLP